MVGAFSEQTRRSSPPGSSFMWQHDGDGFVSAFCAAPASCSRPPGQHPEPQADREDQDEDTKHCDRIECRAVIAQAKHPVRPRMRHAPVFMRVGAALSYGKDMAKISQRAS
jgi:hypothetical protein